MYFVMEGNARGSSSGRRGRGSEFRADGLRLSGGAGVAWNTIVPPTEHVLHKHSPGARSTRIAVRSQAQPDMDPEQVSSDRHNQLAQSIWTGRRECICTL